MRQLVIMRGLPGSGKSTRAKRYIAEMKPESSGIFSADDFFIDPDGVYRWNGAKLDKAHEWNNERIKAAVEQNTQIVIADNVHAFLYDMRASIKIAEKHNYEVIYLKGDAPWALDPNECAKRSLHGISVAAVSNMMYGWHNLED